ncbi:MAG: GTPase [Thermodesulfobacteriota bacterium]|nr:MAG: GTPase [Thermodesulfobacteriota bacterium]
MGAAGRDFHNFNVLYRDDPSIEVVAFTAAQIPFIENRTYPPSLAGPLYPEGIRIYPEDELPELIKKYGADEVVFSYSDVSYEYVMQRAALAISLGAGFVLPSAEAAMIKAERPVISVSAVRTGCGKSGVTRYIGKKLLQAGKRPVAIRHPMPYGDLERQRLQRFSSREDLVKAQCTIEELEEYEPLVESGLVVYAGVDYRAILDEAEKEGNIILWDGGNNDLPFIRPDFEIVVTDPLRPGHELGYYPGEANLRRAHLVVVNKAGSAGAEVELVASNARAVNPRATILRTDSAITVEGDIKGKKALVVEDGPTLTHGGMAFGAGIAAARAFGAVPVDPRPYASGTIKEAFRKYPDLQNLLPAMGYSEGQKKELQEIIEKTPADLVLIATPIDLSRVVPITKPAVRVRYEIEEMDRPGLWDEVRAFLSKTG